MSARVRVFAHRRGNVYMRDIARLLCHEIGALGVSVELVTAGVPGRGAPGDTLDIVVAPHEYAVFEPQMHGERAVEVMARCAAVTTEQPGTAWFAHGTAQVRDCPAVVDVSPVAAALMAADGIAAEPLRFGHTPFWDRWGGVDRRPRMRDITVLAAVTEHRARALHQLAPVLAERRSHLALFDNAAPATELDPWFVHGDLLLALLASSRVLLNLRRDPGRRYFEWIRCLPAVLNGAVVVTEPSFGTAPLRAVEHMVVAPPEGLGARVTALLDDEAGRRQMASAAYEAIRSIPPLSASVARFLERAGDALGVRVDVAAAPSHPALTVGDLPVSSLVGDDRPPLECDIDHLVVPGGDDLAGAARRLDELTSPLVLLQREGDRWAPRGVRDLLAAIGQVEAPGDDVVGAYGLLATADGRITHDLPWDARRLCVRPCLGPTALVRREVFASLLRAADALRRRYAARGGQLDASWAWHLPWLLAAGRGMRAARTFSMIGWTSSGRCEQPAPAWLRDAVLPGHWPAPSDATHSAAGHCPARRT